MNQFVSLAFILYINFCMNTCVIYFQYVFNKHIKLIASTVEVEAKTMIVN